MVKTAIAFEVSLEPLLVLGGKRILQREGVILTVDADDGSGWIVPRA